VNISNINALNNVQVSDVFATVIGGDINVDVSNIANNLDVDVAVLNNSVNDNFVQVAVAVLSDQDLVGAGSDAVNLYVTLQRFIF
jgi:hypothetical protein